MSQLMIDTSAYAAFKLGHPEAKLALREAASIVMPAVVLGELWAGFEAGSQRERNRRELEAFLRTPRVSFAPVAEETAERYALIYAFLRANGRPIPTNDLWIAASAMEHGATLLTADMHFLRVPQIMVRHISDDTM